jgi:hypothetical protein
MTKSQKVKYLSASRFCVNQAVVCCRIFERRQVGKEEEGMGKECAWWREWLSQKI